RQSFSELDTPLIKRIDVPDRSLGENAVLIKCHQLAERLRGQAIGEDNIRRPIPFKDTMRLQPFRRALGLYLLRCLSEGERFSLREEVGKQHVVMPPEWRKCVTERDKITRNKARPLVNQLIERMLSVRARFAPINRPGIVIDLFAVQSDVLAVTLHR